MFNTNGWLVHSQLFNLFGGGIEKNRKVVGKIRFRPISELVALTNQNVGREP